MSIKGRLRKQRKKILKLALKKLKRAKKRLAEQLFLKKMVDGWACVCWSEPGKSLTVCPMIDMKDIRREDEIVSLEHFRRAVGCDRIRKKKLCVVSILRYKSPVEEIVDDHNKKVRLLARKARRNK